MLSQQQQRCLTKIFTFHTLFAAAAGVSVFIPVVCSYTTGCQPMMVPQQRHSRQPCILTFICKVKNHQLPQPGCLWTKGRNQNVWMNACTHADFTTKVVHRWSINFSLWGDSINLWPTGKTITNPIMPSALAVNT